jgi:hypothetical protein
MANELQILPNPDNIPGAVTSGYQRQNTNFFASTVGLNLLNLTITGNILTVLQGGIVEVNGNLYKVPANITKSLDTSKSNYVHLLPVNENYINLNVSQHPGTFNSSKNGYYYNNARVIEIKTLQNSSNPPPQPSNEILVVNISGITETTATLESGWYKYELKSGAGGPGGNGGAGGLSGNGGQGGDGFRRHLNPITDKWVTTTISGSRGAEGSTDSTPGAIGGTFGEWEIIQGSFYINSKIIIRAISGGVGQEGQLGGPGHKGADGAKGFSFSNENILYNGGMGANGGNGGNGGSGGQGGRGGNSMIISDTINLVATGGIGGQGGQGGPGSIGGTGGAGAISYRSTVPNGITELGIPYTVIDGGASSKSGDNGVIGIRGLNNYYNHISFFGLNLEGHVKIWKLV